jgi:hypothetical protein
MENGLIVITPSSVSSTGTTDVSGIKADGSVSFTNCETLTVNDVFTSAYDNYLIEMRYQGTDDQRNLLMRFTTSGVEYTITRYRRQLLSASSSTALATRQTSLSAFYIGLLDSELRSGISIQVYAPALLEPKVVRSRGVSGDGNARFWDEGGSFTGTDAYDGFKFLFDGSSSTRTATGQLTVFAYNQ